MVITQMVKHTRGTDPSAAPQMLDDIPWAVESCLSFLHHLVLDRKYR